MAKHHPDLIMCRKQPGISEAPLRCFCFHASRVSSSTDRGCAAAAIGRLCQKCKRLAPAAPLAGSMAPQN